MKFGLTSSPPRVIVTKTKNSTPPPQEIETKFCKSFFLEKNDGFQQKLNNLNVQLKEIGDHIVLYLAKRDGNCVIQSSKF